MFRLVRIHPDWKFWLDKSVVGLFRIHSYWNSKLKFWIEMDNSSTDLQQTRLKILFSDWLGKSRNEFLSETFTRVCNRGFFFECNFQVMSLLQVTIRGFYDFLHFLHLLLLVYIALQSGSVRRMLNFPNLNYRFS